MKKVIAVITAFFLISSLWTVPVLAASPSQDMRAVWMATVFNIDFPNVKNNAASQQAEFVEKIEALKAVGINTIIVQVRPKADALYRSSINPWSDVLTGVQGKDPGYDPMQFMIEETHKRGMAFHAWLNPYRVTTSGTDVNLLSENHPARNNPEWTFTHNNALYYNPEMPEVRKHIVATIEEIVKNYDVDGIHFDDYFYPSNYPLPQGEGKNGIVANQRRENVNEMISSVRTAIKKINKNVAFGVSPTGIWKNKTSDSTGSDTGGYEAYFSVFADARAWIQNGWVDYIVPQIYWETGHKLADYETLVKWWSNEVKGTAVKLYIGQGIYRDVVAKQIGTQLQINQKYPEVKGSFYYSLRDLLVNRQDCKEQIKSFNSAFPLEVIQTPKPAVEPVSQEATQTINKSGVVTATTLNIRSGAGTNFAVVTKLLSGTKVAVLTGQGEWYKLKTPSGQIGWAMSNYVKFEATVSKQAVQALSAAPKTKTATVTVNSLNIRSGAGTHFGIVTKLAKGTKVTLLEVKNGWCKVKLANGKIGWAVQSYITY